MSNGRLTGLCVAEASEYQCHLEVFPSALRTPSITGGQTLHRREGIKMAHLQGDEVGVKQEGRVRAWGLEQAEVSNPR
jgi:hypothetical protein